MGKYGSGLSSGQVANLEKEEIREALNGRIRVGENEDGFVYAPCDDKERLNSIILHAYDAIYFQLNQSLASARALEKMYHDMGGTVNLPKYQEALLATAMTDEYIYEDDEEDDDGEE